MRGHLQATALGAFDQLRETRRLDQDQAAVAGIVAVVLGHGRAAAAERPVDQELHPAHLQPLAGMCVGAVRAQPVQRAAIAIGIGADPQRQAPCVGEAAQLLEIGQRGAHVVQAGQPLAHGGGQGEVQRTVGIGLVQVRGHRRDQPLGLVDEHAGRPAAGGAHDQAAIGLAFRQHRAGGGIGRDRAQHRRVHPACVAIDAAQPHRSLGKDGVQVGGGGKDLFGPVVLVPSTTDQPLARRQVPFERLQAFEDLALAARADQVGTGQRHAQSDDVRVRIDEPGHDGRIAQVDQARVGVTGLQHSALAHREDASLLVPDHRLRHRPVRVGGVDPAGLQQGLGAGREGYEHSGTKQRQHGLAKHGRRIRRAVAPDATTRGSRCPARGAGRLAYSGRTSTRTRMRSPGW